MEIGERIAQLRKSRNLSQEELAEKLLVSRQIVSLWESGKSLPSTDNIKALCAAVAKSRPSTVKGIYVRNAVVHTTMGPGLHITFDGRN